MKTQLRESMRPDCPPDERIDINREALRYYLDDIGRMSPDDVLEDIQAITSNPEYMSKAVILDSWMERYGVVRRKGSRGRDHQSVLYLNEFGIVDNAQGLSRWVERPATGFEFLRDVAYGVDVIQAIIVTRQRQVSAFLKPDRAQGPLGFHFVRVDGERMSDADKKAVRRIERMLLDGGDQDDYFERRRLRRPDLHAFVSAIVRDTLVADACPIELTYRKDGKLSGWHNIDFSTVRLCVESGYEGDDELTAVQVIDQIPRVAYGYRDLIYEVRNPRTELRVNGYGYSENEVAIRALTGYLNGITFNAAGLDRNATPRGFITLIGDYDQDQLTSFKRQMMLMLRGATNRWNIPIMSAREGGAPVWTPMDNFNEMFFARWITLVTSITCALHGIDPSEINMDSFSVRPSSLSGDNTAQKLAQSRDKGLVPLLAFVERILNIIVGLIDKRYRFEFVGLFEEDAQQKHDRLRIGASINEVRELDGRGPFEDPVIGNAPANPSLMMLYQQQLQQQQQGGIFGGGMLGAGGEQQAAAGGEGDGGPGDGWDGVPPEWLQQQQADQPAGGAIAKGGEWYLDLDALRGR